MKAIESQKRKLFSFIFSSIILIFSFQINISHAQALVEPFDVFSKFEMIEISEIRDINNSVSSIEIPLYSANLNINNVEVNFSDIRLGQEIKTIEDSSDTYVSLTWKNRNSIGIELNITEPTVIYGVYLKGWCEPLPNPVGYVQINGYNNFTDTPDNNILGRTLINISNIPTWYIQEFNEPIPISAGHYYLIINGTGLLTSDDKFFLAYNNSGSVHQYLHKATLHSEDLNWVLDITGEPLLHKLIQRVNRTYVPEEINMTAQIDGNIFPILNGTDEASGFLNISERINPNSENFHISISHNQSIILLFNLSYCIKSQNLLLSDGYASITENSINWTINPIITRVCNYLCVGFNYPLNWFNLKIKRNNEDICSNVTMDPMNCLIMIPNNTILETAVWEITANSPNIELEIELLETNWKPGQNLQFSIEPSIPGNYIFILINSLGYEQTRIEKQIPLENNIFSYNIPLEVKEGIFKIHIFWNNMTDAGYNTSEFSVNIPPSIDFQLIFIILLAISIIVSLGYSSAVALKRINNKIKDNHQKTINKVKDVLNLYYVIVTEKNSGLTIYDKLFTGIHKAGKRIDSTLISGFLHAIRIFGIELTEIEEQTQTIKLDYKNLTILMSEFKRFRLIFVMRKSPSPIFLNTIKSLSYDIDIKYAAFLDNFDGSLNEFRDMKNMLEYHLRINLLYPFKIIPQNIKLNTEERNIIDEASKIMETNNMDHFFLSNLLPGKTGFQIKRIETILNLIKKEIFQS